MFGLESSEWSYDIELSRRIEVEKTTQNVN